MITLKQVVIVEGKYDKIKLQSFIDSLIIETNGFRIFKDKAKQKMLCNIAQKQGIIIMTDSDGAGLVIRNFLMGIMPCANIINCYVPEILGKEKRKETASKAGFLGVEGLTQEVILTALQNCGVNSEIAVAKTDTLTKSDLYELGLTGTADSKQLRKELLKHLELPHYLSTNALMTFLNNTLTKEKLIDIINQL